MKTLIEEIEPLFSFTHEDPITENECWGQVFDGCEEEPEDDFSPMVFLKSWEEAKLNTPRFETKKKEIQIIKYDYSEYRNEIKRSKSINKLKKQEGKNMNMIKKLQLKCKRKSFPDSERQLMQLEIETDLRQQFRTLKKEQRKDKERLQHKRREKALNQERIECHQEEIVEREEDTPAYKNMPTETFQKPEKARRNAASGNGIVIHCPFCKFSTRKREKIGKHIPALHMADIPRKTEENVSPFIRHTKLYRSIPKAVISTTDGKNFYVTFDSRDSEKEKTKCNNSSSDQSDVTEKELKDKTVPVETDATIDQHPEDELVLARNEEQNVVVESKVAHEDKCQEFHDHITQLMSKNKNTINKDDAIMSVEDGEVDVYNDTKLTMVEDIAEINDRYRPEHSKRQEVIPETAQADPNGPILSENRISEIARRIWDGFITVRQRQCKLLKTPIHTSSLLGPEGRGICKQEENYG